MTESLSNGNHHISRLHHHLARVRHHRAQIAVDAQQATAEHYARTETQTPPSGPAEPNQGSNHE